MIVLHRQDNGEPIFLDESGILFEANPSGGSLVYVASRTRLVKEDPASILVLIADSKNLCGAKQKQKVKR